MSSRRPPTLLSPSAKRSARRTWLTVPPLAPSTGFCASAIAPLIAIRSTLTGAPLSPPTRTTSNAPASSSPDRLPPSPALAKLPTLITSSGTFSAPETSSRMPRKIATKNDALRPSRGGGYIGGGWRHCGCCGGTPGGGPGTGPGGDSGGNIVIVSLPSSRREDAARHDQPLDVGRAFVDLGDARVAQEPFGRRGAAGPLVAEDRDRRARRAVAQARCAHLGHRRLGAAADTAVAQDRRAPGEHPVGVELCREVGEHPLVRLRRGRPALAVDLRRQVRLDQVDARARDAERLRRDAEPAAVERVERDREADAFVADPVVGRHLDALEHDLGGRRGADAELALLLADADAGVALLDQERGDALGAVGAGAREHDEQLRLVAGRDPQLAAVEHVVVALQLGDAAQRRRVAARE